MNATDPAEAGLSIILPVFNEAPTISGVIERVMQSASDHHWDWELLIVNDGSTDATPACLRPFSRHPRVRIFDHERNRGKGAAIRTALAAANRDLTVVQDADFEYDPSEIAVLVEAASRKQVDVVYGSRILGAASGIAESRRNVYSVGVWVLNVVVRLLYGRRLTDEATCYKLFRTSDLRRMELECLGFEFCPEVTAKAFRLGLSLAEVPISYHPRSLRDGKKIRFRDAIVAIRTLWRFRRWSPKNA